MEDKKKVPDSDKKEIWSFRAVGIVFLIAGLVMIISDRTSVVGTPFLILGVVFFAFATNEPPTKRKK